MSRPAPAFYALGGGGARDYVTLLHPPYTAWHLSYVVVGACLAAVVDWWVLGLTVLAFGLAMGVGAHALDELNGRPLGTGIPSRVLIGLAVVSVAAATALGIAVAVAETLWIVPLVVVGVALVPVYNLELAFHNDVGFAVAWGAFPALTGYFVEAQTIRVEAVAAAAFALAASLAQRALSTPAREARRREGTTAGTEPLERALRLLTWGMVALAVGLVAARLR